MRCVLNKKAEMNFSSESRRAPKSVTPSVAAGETTRPDQSYVSGLAPWWSGASEFVLHVYPHLAPARWYEMAVLLNQIRPGEKAVLGCAWDGTRGTRPRLLIPPVNLRDQGPADAIKKYDPSKKAEPPEGKRLPGPDLDLLATYPHAQTRKVYMGLAPSSILDMLNRGAGSRMTMADIARCKESGRYRKGDMVRYVTNSY